MNAGWLLVRAGDLTIPTDPASLFGRTAPLILEVGFGDGGHLVDLSRSHPDCNVLGAEVSLGSVWRAWRRMQREGLENVRLYKGNARFLVRDVIPDGALQKVYVNFPDPWPRKKHWKNRLLQAPFFQTLSSRLADDGALLLTTDHPEYFSYACAQAVESDCFDVVEGPPPPATLKTKYARKWQDQNKPIHHAEFRLVHRAASSPRTIQTHDMQHAFLTGNLTDIGPFTKQIRQFDGGTAVVLDAWRNLDGSGVLFRCVIDESDLRQEVMIVAGEKKGGVYIALQPFGDPMTTTGVKEAVRAVATWLEAQGLTLEKAWI